MDYSPQSNPRGAKAINVSIAVGAIAIVAVLLRLAARSRSKAPLALDDYLIVSSLLPLFAMISASILMVTHGGLGKSVRTLEPSQMSIILKVLDVVVLCLPMHSVWSLQITERQRLGLCGLFLLGGFVCIAGLMRIVTIGHLAEDDISYSLISEYIWSQIEPATAIVCACIVTYRPLFTTSLFESLASKIYTTTKRDQGKSIAGSDSTGSRSMSEHTMAWPIARDIFGRELKPDHELYSKAGKGGLHVVSVGEIARSLEERLDGRTSPGAISVTRSFTVTRG